MQTKIEVTDLPSALRRKAAELYAQVYKDDPAIGSMFGHDVSPRFLERALTAYFDVLIGLGLKCGRVLCVMDGSELAAASIYYPPGTYPAPTKYLLWAAVTIVWRMIWLGGLAKLPRLYGIFAGLTDKHPPEPHYYGEIACVAKRVQGQGTAGAMLKYGLGLADRDGVGFYIETSNPRNVPLWGRFGFNPIGEQTVDGVTYWSMWRVAGASVPKARASVKAPPASSASI